MLAISPGLCMPAGTVRFMSRAKRLTSSARFATPADPAVAIRLSGSVLPGRQPEVSPDNASDAHPFLCVTPLRAHFVQLEPRAGAPAACDLRYSAGQLCTDGQSSQRSQPSGPKSGESTRAGVLVWLFGTSTPPEFGQPKSNCSPNPRRALYLHDNKRCV